LAEIKHNKYPIACEVIPYDFYTEALLIGTSSKEEARKVQNDLRDILKQAGIKLI
jgi:hypothetical protein